MNISQYTGLSYKAQGGLVLVFIAEMVGRYAPFIDQQSIYSNLKPLICIKLWILDITWQVYTVAS